MAKEYPALKNVPGFSWLGINLGIKDETPDFGVIASDCKCSAAGVFTKKSLKASISDSQRRSNRNKLEIP